MRRQCAWFGCSANATSTYTFDSETCTVWLDTPFEGGARAGDLCDRHARSLKPPRGWQLEDRRAAPAPSPSPAAPAESGPEQSGADDLRVLLDARSPLLARAFRSSGTI
jgi:Protein of unknown function (DUF3499)